MVNAREKKLLISRLKQQLIIDDKLQVIFFITLVYIAVAKNQ